jgi:hypothetical protein
MKVLKKFSRCLSMRKIMLMMALILSLGAPLPIGTIGTALTEL